MRLCVCSYVRVRVNVSLRVRLCVRLCMRVRLRLWVCMHVLLLYARVSAIVCAFACPYVRVCVCVRLTEAAPVAGHGGEGPPPCGAVGPSRRGLPEGARVLVQEGVHGVGRRGAAVPHHWLWGDTLSK